MLRTLRSSERSGIVVLLFVANFSSLPCSELCLFTGSKFSLRSIALSPFGHGLRLILGSGNVLNDPFTMRALQVCS